MDSYKLMKLSRRCLLRINLVYSISQRSWSIWHWVPAAFKQSFQLKTQQEANSLTVTPICLTKVSFNVLCHIVCNLQFSTCRQSELVPLLPPCSVNNTTPKWKTLFWAVIWDCRNWHTLEYDVSQSPSHKTVFSHAFIPQVSMPAANLERQINDLEKNQSNYLCFRNCRGPLLWCYIKDYLVCYPNPVAHEEKQGWSGGHSWGANPAMVTPERPNQFCAK